ncbi:hypothetical protein TrLO_g6118 [Triparma laevis f. longispina]|uniref:Uncharacterized protein n=1 Tax=Triparma laevis f. longispina TaxID=1714387 RepID=A0A9W7A0D3_9STRA|nr:hypothetical protein TrLO_g6118 [Triparma laevis f. longispina]
MFSASNNTPDEEDPYGFDIDFNKKLTSKKSFDMDMDFSDDEEEDDPAKKFKDKKKKGRGKETEKRKEVKSGSALDRASAYLSKYKGPAAKSKEKKKENPPPSPATDNLEDFLAESSEDDSPKPQSHRRERRGSVERTFKSTSLSGSPEFKKPAQKTSGWDNHEIEMDNIDKMFENTRVPEQGGQSPSLGNTIKSKFSSPMIGVLKSGSDIKDIYRSQESPKTNNNNNSMSMTPKSADRSSFVSERSNISESMDESIAEDVSFSKTETRGKVMGFDQLAVFSGMGDEGAVGTPSPAKHGKMVSFKSTEKVSPNKSGGNESFASQSYSDADFEEEEDQHNQHNDISHEQTQSGSLSHSHSGGMGSRSISGKLPPMGSSPNHGKVMSFDMLQDVVAPVTSSAPQPPPAPIQTQTQTVVTTPIKQSTQMTTSTSPMEGRAKMNVGTQFCGNHAATQVDLAPSTMYGTSSSLDARFTMEMQTFQSTGYDARLQSEAGLLVMPPPPPANYQKKGLGLNVSLAAGADAYLQMLMQSREEARLAREQVATLSGSVAVQPNFGRSTIQPTFIDGKTTVNSLYEKEAGGLDETKKKMRGITGSKKSPKQKATPSKDKPIDQSGSFASYNSSFDAEEDEDEDEDEESRGSLSLSASEGDDKGDKLNVGGGNPFKYTGASSLFGTKVTLPTDTKSSVGSEAMGSTGRSMAMGATANTAGGNQIPLNLHSSDPTLQLLAVQSMFRRQLDMVRRSVAAARAENMASSVPATPVATREGGGRKKKNIKKKKKTKGGESSRGKRGMNAGPKVLKYWEALMRVDPSLTKSEAKRLAKESQ